MPFVTDHAVHVPFPFFSFLVNYLFLVATRGGRPFSGVPPLSSPFYDKFLTLQSWTSSSPLKLSMSPKNILGIWFLRPLLRPYTCLPLFWSLSAVPLFFIPCVLEASPPSFPFCFPPRPPLLRRRRIHLYLPPSLPPIDPSSTSASARFGGSFADLARKHSSH